MEADHPTPRFCTLEKSIFCVHLNLLSHMMIRLADYVLTSFEPRLRFRWTGLTEGATSAQVNPAHNPQTPKFVFRDKDTQYHTTRLHTTTYTQIQRGQWRNVDMLEVDM